MCVTEREREGEREGRALSVGGEIAAPIICSSGNDKGADSEVAMETTPMVNKATKLGTKRTKREGVTLRSIIFEIKGDGI